jgi:hypothetical protein
MAQEADRGDQLPAWPIPIHHTKLIAKPQPTGAFTPQTPMPDERTPTGERQNHCQQESIAPTSQKSGVFRVAIEEILSVTSRSPDDHRAVPGGGGASDSLTSPSSPTSPRSGLQSGFSYDRRG